MKTLVIALALLISVPTLAASGPKRAAAEACQLCDDLIKTMIQIKENTETDEVKRQTLNDTLVSQAVESLEKRLKKKSKLSAKEIDMIFKFEVEMEAEDNLHQLMELIYPLYKADKKIFQDRIERSPYKAKIKEFLKALEREEKQGNG